MKTTKTKDNKQTTISRAFLVRLLNQIQAADFTKKSICAALDLIKNQAAQLNKISWYIYADRVAVWLENVNNRPPLTMFKIGNSKLPFLSWSTLPGINCPGAAECWAAGLGWCYSLKAWRYPAAFFRQLQNTILERGEFGRAIIAQEIARILESSEFRDLKTVTLRLYVDGDFNSLKTLKFWLKIAENNPRLRIYGYSKSLPFFTQLIASGYKFPKNYVLNLSNGGRYFNSAHYHQLKNYRDDKGETFVRGDFLAVKVDTSGINSAINRTKAERKQLRLQFPGEKIFICPGLCGECTNIKETPHACGNNKEFANTKIVIPVH